MLRLGRHEESAETGLHPVPREAERGPGPGGTPSDVGRRRDLHAEPRPNSGRILARDQKREIRRGAVGHGDRVQTPCQRAGRTGLGREPFADLDLMATAARLALRAGGEPGAA